MNRLLFMLMVANAELVEVNPETLEKFEGELKPTPETKGEQISTFLQKFGLEPSAPNTNEPCVSLSFSEALELKRNVEREVKHWKERAEKAEECLEKVRNFIGVAYPDIE